MAKRSRSQQTKHDRKVGQIARRLDREGYRVKADLPGYERPDPIGKAKRIPDVEATKRGTRKLVEVETEDSLEKDQKQQETFRRSAAQRRRTTFDIEEA